MDLIYIKKTDGSRRKSIIVLKKFHVIFIFKDTEFVSLSEKKEGLTFFKWIFRMGT